MSKILELRENVQRLGKQQRHSWIPSVVQTVFCLQRMWQLMTKWKRMW